MAQGMHRASRYDVPYYDINMLILEMSDWHFKLYCQFWHKKVGDSAVVCARIWHGGLDVYVKFIITAD